MIINTGWYVQHKSKNGNVKIVKFTDEKLAKTFATMVNGTVNSSLTK